MIVSRLGTYADMAVTDTTIGLVAWVLATADTLKSCAP
jgi:hypothetical protein